MHKRQATLDIKLYNILGAEDYMLFLERLVTHNQLHDHCWRGTSILRELLFDDTTWQQRSAKHYLQRNKVNYMYKKIYIHNKYLLSTASQIDPIRLHYVALAISKTREIKSI